MLTTIPDNFVYFGLFLTNKSKEELKEIANNIAPKQMAEATNIYLEHITLLHKNDKYSNLIKLRMYELLNHLFEIFIGETYEVTITHIGFNQNAMAFKVELPDGFPRFIYKIYHITICTFNNAKPIESNNIINWHKLDIINWHKLFKPITITTVLRIITI